MMMIIGWLNVEEINKNKNLPTGLKKTKKIRQRENLICSCKQADCYNTLFFLFKRTKKKYNNHLQSTHCKRNQKHIE